MEGLSSKLSRFRGTESAAALLRAPIPLQPLSWGPGGAWAVSTVPSSVLGPWESKREGFFPFFPLSGCLWCKSRCPGVPVPCGCLSHPGPATAVKPPFPSEPLPVAVPWAGGSPFPPCPRPWINDTNQ